MLHLAMRRRSFKSPIRQGRQLVVAEKVRSFSFHYTQNPCGELANFSLGVTAGSQLDEVAQGARVRRHENLGLGSIGEHAACRLPGQFTPERLVRLVLE